MSSPWDRLSVVLQSHCFREAPSPACRGTRSSWKSARWLLLLVIIIIKMWSRDRKETKVCKLIIIIIQVITIIIITITWSRDRKKINVNKVMVSENVIIPTVNQDDYELMIVSKYRYHIKHFRTNDCHLWRL